ncbi:hypothetical protein ACOSP7_009013 [Xanthoceras sorbifolium]
MSSSTSSPFAFDPSLLIPEEPSVDFPSLTRTLNFNLPLKLDKTNYVNWKAQLDVVCFTWHSCNNKVYLIKKLFNLKMSKINSFKEHLNAFNEIIDQLNRINLKFEGEIQVLLILG